MTGLDWFIVLILVVSVATAAAEGFFFEIFSFAGAVIGYLLAAWNYHRVGAWLSPYVKSDWVADSAGFLIIFIAVVIIAGSIGRITRWAVQGVGLRWMDRLLGAAFGVLRGMLIVMVICMCMASFGPGSQQLARSQLGEYFLVLGRGAMWLSPYELREKFRDGIQAMHQIQDKASSQQSGTNEKK